MNSAVTVFVVAALAVANAGYLGAPALGVAPVGLSYSSGIVRGSPLYASPAVGLAHVRVGRGIGYAAAPGLVHAAPLGLASPLAVSYSSGIVRSPSAHLVRVGRGIVGAHALAAPLAYSSHAIAAPVAYHAPLAYASPLGYGAPVVKAIY